MASYDDDTLDALAVKHDTETQRNWANGGWPGRHEIPPKHNPFIREQMSRQQKSQRPGTSSNHTLIRGRGQPPFGGAFDNPYENPLASEGRARPPGPESRSGNRYARMPRPPLRSFNIGEPYGGDPYGGDSYEFRYRRGEHHGWEGG
ncbi:MAG: hypothetical protein MMC33_009135 [Icmadophila ericetorum]|nr:hypothetical protein [Icmadophila ericetorum]